MCIVVNMPGLITLIVFLGLFEYTWGSVSCKSSDGKDVDWFIIYKVPHLTGVKNDIITGGTEFFYMDNLSPSFSYRQKDITKSVENPLFETLKILYDKSPGILTYAMYNDQPPFPIKAADSKSAHSKGALAFDNTKGFWIVSSVPRFPAPISNGFTYLNPQTKYGQTILCVTVAKTVENILKSAFETTNPYIYDNKNFNINVQDPMASSHLSLKTLGNVQLDILAKSASFGQDIYDKLISPKLSDSLLVRTWRPDLLNTNMVSTVRDACFDNGIAFNDGKDHSKWAVSEKLPLICIGDINRQESQYKRGGLSLCLTNKDVAEEFRQLNNRCATNNLKRMPPTGVCPNLKKAKLSP